MIQQLTCAYLRTALGVDDTAWKEARAEAERCRDPEGEVRSK